VTITRVESLALDAGLLTLSSDHFYGVTSIGADTFVFTGVFGQDTVTDFQDGTDLLDMNAGLSFAARTITAVDAGADGAADDVQVETGGSFFEVLDTALGAIDAADFLF